MQAVDVSCYSLIALAGALKPLLRPRASVVALSISSTRMAAEGYGYMAPAKAALDASVVFLAKITGNPIIPFHIEAARHWTTRSWDRTQVPKPWSAVGIAIGEPFPVPADIDDEGLEAYRVELERRLATLETRATELSNRR